MIEWLVENRQWVFSGIGVLVLTVAWQHFSARRQPSVGKPGGAESAEIAAEPTSLTALEIHNAIGSAPPLQRTDVGKNYSNIRVRWNTLLSSATARGAKVRLQLTNANEGSHGAPTIWCQVEIAKYPELAVLTADTKIQVLGTIAKAEYFSIELEAVELQIGAESAAR